MKKICELAVVSRKSVKGPIICRFEVKSKAEESLGCAEVALQKEEAKGGIYFRYIPNQEADAEEAISIIEIRAENQEVVTNILQGFKDELIKKSMNEFGGNILSKIMATVIASRCVNVEEGKIELLDDFEINITNGMISQYLNDEWLGIEGRYDKGVVEKINELIEEKQERELSELAELMKSIAKEDDYSEFLKKYYKQDEDDE